MQSCEGSRNFLADITGFIKIHSTTLAFVNPDHYLSMTPEILTVSALNQRVRATLQQNFSLLWITGEVSNLTRAASGHLYFSLKDDTAQVRCAMFRNRAQQIPWHLENGHQVEAQVVVTLYEARGEFQLNIESLRRAGLGKLYEAFARLREKLEHEGLFAVEKKRHLPRFPHRIGIVSSPQAAAMHDIIISLQHRAPFLPLILYPTPVQGDGSAEKIAAAIALAGERSAKDRIDVLIVARGGGSIEDLWAFNEEAVARAIATCPVPVVSGVGHENDISIADLAADQRAATPTAAAELVSAGWFNVANELLTLRINLTRTLRKQLETRMQRLDLLTHRLTHPGRQLERNSQTIAHLATRLSSALAQHLRQNSDTLAHWRLRLTQVRPAIQISTTRLALARQRFHTLVRHRLEMDQAHLNTMAAALMQLNPQTTLERGYSIVRNQLGTVISNSNQLAAGDAIELYFAEGRAQGRVSETSLTQKN